MPNPAPSMKSTRFPMMTMPRVATSVAALFCSALIVTIGSQTGYAAETPSAVGPKASSAKAKAKDAQAPAEVAEVKLSRKRGLHETPFDLALTTGTGGAVIRYTTNGSDPTAQNGSTYQAPLKISRTNFDFLWVRLPLAPARSERASANGWNALCTL